MPIVRVSKRVGGIRSRRGIKRRGQINYPMSTAGRQYLRTILNPSYGGAKIPDSFGAKTCTIQLQREKKLTAVAVGSDFVVGGLMQVSVAPFTFSIGNNAGTPQWNSDAYVEGQASYTNCKIHTLMRSARVVSAGLKVQYTGTTQNDQGTITVFAVDRPHLAQGVVTGGVVGNPDHFINCSKVDPIGDSFSSINADSLRNLPVNAFGPLRQGATARFFPVDDTDLEFHPVPNSPNSNAYTVGTVGALGFYADGLATGTSVIVQYTVNLECTVRDDSFHMVSTESSPVDGKALARCAITYLKKPQVAVGGLRGDTESINVYSR